MKIDFATAVRLFFTKYATFTGRATRAEYWWVMLFLFLVSMVLGWLGKFGTILSLIFSIACIVPQLSLSFRRLHDSGLSGWIAGIYTLIGLAICVWMFVAGGSTLIALQLNPSAVTPDEVLSLGSAIAWPSICMVLMAIVWLVLMCRKSDSDNQYGPRSPELNSSPPKY